MTTSMPIAASASASGELWKRCSPRLTAPTVPACTATGPTPVITRRIALIPIAALASSPVERSVKNFVGSLNSRSHTAGCRVLSIRRSIRGRVRLCSSMNVAPTTLVIIRTRHTCAIRSVCARGTNVPST